MKKTLLLLASALLCFSIVGFAQPRSVHSIKSSPCTGVTVAFNQDINAGCAPLCVNFTDLSTTTSGVINSWYWSFGDGGNSNSQNPIWCYVVPGTYVVKLVITTSSGCKDSIADTVKCYPNPVAAFKDSAIGKYDYLFTDTVKSSKGDSLWWYFGDGVNVRDTSLNVQHTFPGPGEYNICLYVYNKYGCSDSVCDSIFISIVGINNLNNPADKISLYPNPAGDELHISFAGLMGERNAEIEIVDVAGQKIFSQTLDINNNMATINTSSLAAGAYFVRIQSMKNSQVLLFMKE